MDIIMASRNILPFHKYCGTGRYVHGLAKHLVELGASVEIVAPPERSPRPAEDSADGITYHFIPPEVKGGGFFGFYRSYHHHNIRAAQFLSRQKFDVLHIFEINAFPYLLKKKRAPVVVSPFHRGTEPWKKNNLSARVQELPIDLPLEYCVKSCELVVSEGPAQTKRLIEKYRISADKVAEVPDGVDLDRIAEHKNEPVFSRENVGFSEDDFVLISVGRIDPMKGVAYLVEAFAEVLKELPSTRLILVGEGSDEEKIKTMLHERGISDRVVHAKNVSDRELFSYYNLADVFVTPTLYEGLPQVVLEAMACELPIVATDTGENSQVVKDGLNGFLVPPRQPHVMAEAVLKLYDAGKRRSMGAQSWKIIGEYDWKISAKKALKAYEKVTP
jgi:glycosyltransferase involved in cell wall biosynthesis